MRPHTRLAALLAVAMLFGTARVPAQSGPMEAQIRATQAREAAHRGDAGEAERLYRMSMEIHPTARVARDFALFLEQQGRNRDAADMWTRVATLDPDESARDAAVRRSESLRRLPSLLRVRVLPGLAAREARVWFDHDPPRPVPVGGAESTVEGGAHRVRVESVGWVPFETMVNTAYGEPADVVAHLARASTGGDTAGIVARDAGRD